MGRFAVLIQRLTGWDEVKVRLKLWRALVLAESSGLFAVILFVVLWLLAATSGCAHAPPQERREPQGRFNLSLEISRITSQMRRAGCFPKDVNVAYMNPTSYTVSVSGAYYERYDTNNVEGVKK